MIRLREEQLDAFREEMREAFAGRLARRGAVRYPEKVLGRAAEDLLADARLIAGAARERGLVSEEDVTLFYDLSMELGPGFEQGPGGAWARAILKERGRRPHERIVALCERVFRVEEWDPYRDRVRRTLTGRVSRVVAKGPPRRLDVLRQRRAELAGIAARLRTPSDAKEAPEAGPRETGLLGRVEEAWRVVQNEHALRLELGMIDARARGRAAEERAERDAARRAALGKEVAALAVRFEKVRRVLSEHLAEGVPRTGSSDAEDPCVARVETDRVSEREAVRAESERRRRIARDLTTPSGSADAGDQVVVALELARLPGEAVDLLRRSGTRVVACRGAVTEHRTDLVGARPRGWPPGSSWRDVPGLFDGGRNEVVVATRGHGPRRPGRVPATGDGHGSASLAVHVACHAIDARCGKPSGSSEFKAARAADRDALPEYCRQPGSAGLEESWAESAARWAAEPDGMSSRLPSLHRYWHGWEVAGAGTGTSRTVLEAGREMKTTRVRRRSSIGSARLDEAGAIVLDLRATDGRGILGDGRLVFPASHPLHEEVLVHLGGLAPEESKPVPPWPDRR